MADPSKVRAKALDLLVRERLRIAGALLRSVDPEEDEDAAGAWVAELIDAAAAHAHVHDALRARRASRR